MESVIVRDPLLLADEKEQGSSPVRCHEVAVSGIMPGRKNSSFIYVTAYERIATLL